MTRSVAEVLRFGFEELALNRVEATVHPDNHRSVRVLEKLGFQVEGRLREYRRGRQGSFDCLMFSLLRREWTDRR